MKTEKEKKEYNSLFKDVSCGQCFKHFSGGFYIKMHELSKNNCVSLETGWPGICFSDDKVKVFKNTKVILGD